MFEQMIRAMDSGKEFFQPVGAIGMYKKDEFYTITRGVRGELPFKTVEMYGDTYKITHEKMHHELALELQVFIWNNYSRLLIGEARHKTAWLKEYLSEKRIMEATSLIDGAEELIKTKGYPPVIEILDTIVKVDEYQDFFYEFFNKMAEGSSTPMADFMNPVVEALKMKLELLNWDLSDFFDLFWEYRESIKNGDVYNLEFVLNDVESAYEIDSVERLIEVYEKYIR